MRASLVFPDESGFLLAPPVGRTWGLRGLTPIVKQSYDRRQRLSVISAVRLSPKMRRLTLYFQIHRENLTSRHVAAFLEKLLRAVPGEIVLLWDRWSPHRAGPVRQILARHPRLHIEHFPAYAPELNPDEQVWQLSKDSLRGGAPRDARELTRAVRGALRRIGKSQRHLKACVNHSALPLFLPRY